MRLQWLEESQITLLSHGLGDKRSNGFLENTLFQILAEFGWRAYVKLGKHMFIRYQHI